MIIDSTYFSGKELYIPNMVLQPSIGNNNVNLSCSIMQEIEEKESELILDILGFSQATELYNQFEQDGSWKTTALQKWIDLVDGKDEWRGLRYSVGGKKISLIAYYIFFYYLANDYHTYSTTGMQIAKSENAYLQCPSIKQVSVWNKFIKMYIGNIMINKVHFAENWNGTSMSFNGINLTNEVSLYDFLTKNKDVYDISFFKGKTVINYFGL